MFNGNLDNVIKYCEEIGAKHFIHEMPNGLRMLYILDKEEAEIKEKHPKKYAQLFVSYLRVSKHDDHDYFYTRDNGVVGYRSDRWIKDRIDWLTKAKGA